MEDTNNCSNKEYNRRKYYKKYQRNITYEGATPISIEYDPTFVVYAKDSLLKKECTGNNFGRDIIMGGYVQEHRFDIYYSKKYSWFKNRNLFQELVEKGAKVIYIESNSEHDLNRIGRYFEPPLFDIEQKIEVKYNRKGKYLVEKKLTRKEERTLKSQTELEKEEKEEKVLIIVEAPYDYRLETGERVKVNRTSERWSYSDRRKQVAKKNGKMSMRRQKKNSVNRANLDDMEYKRYKINSRKYWFPGAKA